MSTDTHILLYPILAQYTFEKQALRHNFYFILRRKIKITQDENKKDYYAISR